MFRPVHPPPSGCAGQLPRPGGAVMGAQIRGPTRAQRSGMGDPAEGGTPFAGRAGAAERTKPAACGRMRDAQLATATGEDEQGSGARNARQGVLSGADFARTTSRPTQRRTTSPPCHSEAVRPKNPYSRPFSFLLRTKTGVTDSSPSLRPRKVRFTLFPPDGENSLRSLARPLTTRPTSLGSCCVKDGGYGFFAFGSE